MSHRQKWQHRRAALGPALGPALGMALGLALGLAVVVLGLKRNI